MVQPLRANIGREQCAEYRLRFLRIEALIQYPYIKMKQNHFFETIYCLAYTMVKMVLREEVMKKEVLTVSVIITIALLCSYSLAEGQSSSNWYPFDIKADDSYITASYKVENSLLEQTVERRTKYVQVITEYYYIYDVPIEEITFMDKGDSWLLVIFGTTSLAKDDIENVYSLYMALVEKEGAPIFTSPTIKKTTFDGTVDVSAFDEKDSFVSALESSKYGASFSVSFNSCRMEINVWDYRNVQLILSFDNELR